MPYLSLPGVDLWYEDAGRSGTPVILLHAASGTTDCWVHQLPTFTIAGYRCISYDRRTWGRSRPTESGPQPGFAGDDLHALVESLGLDRFHLVGTAAGAIPALDYALSHPERVRSLVAAIPSAGCKTRNTWRCSTGCDRSKSRTCPWNCASWAPPTGALTPTAPLAGWRLTMPAAPTGQYPHSL